MGIPKIIHYCWFGKGEKNELLINCIASWKKYLPDYQLKEWNEENFDIHSNAYVEEAYTMGKWAFVTDYVRLYVLYNYGGIYMDTDVEVCRSLEPFLKCSAFSGFEARDSVPTGIFASEKGHQVIYDLLQEYNGIHFIDKNGKADMKTNVSRITDYFVKQGLKLNGKRQEIKGVTMYEQITFCPNTFGLIWGHRSVKIYTIHHFDGSWLGKSVKKDLIYRIKHYIGGVVRNRMGSDRYAKFRFGKEHNL